MEPKKLTREQVEQIVREAKERNERPDLNGIDLSRADLSRADLSGTDLIEVDLSGAELIQADLTKADLTKADLSGAKLNGANLTVADLRGAKVNGADLRIAYLTEADLTRADLSLANLADANLSLANLADANLTEADLTEADLTRADLSGAKLFGTDLNGANLSGAELFGADLSGANLSGANLSGANLSWTNLNQTQLDSTNFSNAIIIDTIFAKVDLSQAKGLTEVDHQGPSIIDLNTIYQSKDKIPEAFLKGAGVHADIIRWQHSLHTLPTVFICYSHHDEKEKDLLVTHLNVLKQLGTLDIWDDTQITGGADWEQEIIKAITRSTVAILLVSANFLSSNVINALEIPQFLARHTQDENFLIYPIIIKPCFWDKVPWLEKKEVKPKGGKPIWGKDTDVEEELSKIANEVEGIIKDRWWKAFR